MANKKQVFEMMDKNYGRERIMRECKISKQSYYTYRSLYKKEKANTVVVDTETENKVENKKQNNIKSNKFIVVDLVIQDGTILEECGIFLNNHPGMLLDMPLNGDLPLQQIDDIKYALQKVPWGRKMVFFQNKYLNGSIDVNNIKEYEIKTIEIGD